MTLMISKTAFSILIGAALISTAVGAAILLGLMFRDVVRRSIW